MAGYFWYVLNKLHPFLRVSLEWERTVTNSTSHTPVMGKMWAVIPILNPFLLSFEKDKSQWGMHWPALCTAHAAEITHTALTQSPLTTCVSQAIWLCTGASKEFWFMSGASVPWAAHTHCTLRDSALPQGLLPCPHPVPALALQHFSGSLPWCRWFQPLHLLWESGTHGKKWLCWPGLGIHQAVAESLAGRGVPRKAASCIALCLCDVVCLAIQH